MRTIPAFEEPCRKPSRAAEEPNPSGPIFKRMTGRETRFVKGFVPMACVAAAAAAADGATAAADGAIAAADGATAAMDSAAVISAAVAVAAVAPEATATAELVLGRLDRNISSMVLCVLFADELHLKNVNISS